MTRPSGIVTVIAAMAALSTGRLAAQRPEAMTWQVDGQTRLAFAYPPSSDAGGRPAPLVLSFRGRGDNARSFQGEFNWSSQHLDDAVLRWRNGTGDGQTEQVSLRCVRPVARGERGGRSHNGSGRRSPGGCRVKRPRCPVACRRPWVVVGSVRAVGCRRSAWRRRRLAPCPVRSGGRSQSYARRAPGCATWPVGFGEPRRLSHENGVATRRLDAAVWRIGRRLRRGTAPDVPSGRREPSWPRPIACGAPCRTASQARSGLRTGGPCLAQT